MALYADDVAIFCRQDESEARVIKELLNIFGLATGLFTNLNKSTVTPIRGMNESWGMIQQVLGCTVQHFPIPYLGFSLSLRKPTKTEMQPMMDKLSKKVAGWIPKMLSPDGRLILIKTVLHALPLHFMSVIELPRWAVKEINKKCRAFLWKGQQEVSGGQCLVAWDDVCIPLDCGGLGIKNLDLFGQALRLKWSYLKTDQNDRPWTVVWHQDKNLQVLASSLIKYLVGDGRLINFWKDSWLPQGDIVSNFPILATYISRTNLTVQQALEDGKWIRSFRGSLSVQALEEYLQLWDQLQGFATQPGVMDTAIWKLTDHGAYTAKSAYNFFFMARTKSASANLIWESKVPSRIRFFMWLAEKNRCLTADNLQLRGWQNDPICSLCMTEQETCHHLFIKCGFTNAVWCLMKDWMKVPFQLPGDSDETLTEWWLLARQDFQTGYSTNFDAVVMLTTWLIWKERNSRVFNKIFSTAHKVFDDIREEIKIWKDANVLKPP